jgi:quercetin dioxygenase-like cupin family protein
MPRRLKLLPPGRRTIVLAAIVTAGLGTSVLAQNEARPGRSGLTQSNILREAVARFPGTEAVMFNGDFAPGGMSGQHRHPGPEALHVIEGHGVLLQDGREPVELKPGVTVYSEPPEGETSFVHEVRNSSQTEPLRTFVIVLVEKGMPPSLPAE